MRHRLPRLIERRSRRRHLNLLSQSLHGGGRVRFGSRYDFFRAAVRRVLARPYARLVIEKLATAEESVEISIDVAAPVLLRAVFKSNAAKTEHLAPRAAATPAYPTVDFPTMTPPRTTLTRGSVRCGLCDRSRSPTPCRRRRRQNVYP